MKNNAKRLLAFLLAALLCVTMIVPAFATEAEHDHDHKVSCDADCTHECETKHANSEVIEVVASVCTAAGYTLRYCFDCEHYYVTDVVEAAEGAAHNPGDKVEDGKAATCVTEGVEASYKCTVCGELCDENGGSVDVLDEIDHQYTDGLCVICGRHEDDTCTGTCDWEFVEVTVKPTATANGTAKYKCSVCGAIKSVVILAESARIYPSSLYADIDFTADGTMADRLNKVSLTVKGTVTVGEMDVKFNGTTMTVPALNIKTGSYVKGEFDEFDTAAEIDAWVNGNGGLSIEALYLNKGTSGTQGIVCVTQGPVNGINTSWPRSGWGLAQSAGKPYFITGNRNANKYYSAYATAVASQTDLVHVVAVLDTAAKTNTIYVNGVKNASVASNAFTSADFIEATKALGEFNMATAFFIGGDPTMDARTICDFNVSDLTVVDVKLYASALTADDVKVLYGYAVEDFTPEEEVDELAWVKEILEANNKNFEDYTVLEITPAMHSFWNSQDNAKHSTIINASNNTQTNHVKFWATGVYANADIPVGSLLVVKEGYQYRPDGWQTFGQKNTATRPGNVSDSLTVVNADWYATFTSRAFNVSRVDGAVLTDADLGSFVILVPKTVEHNCALEAVKVPAVAGTCTTKATLEHYKCSCGKLFSDAAATTEITAAETVGDFGHTFGANPTETVEPTCDKYGYKVWACTACGVVSIENIDPKGHAAHTDTTRATNVVTTAATCTTKGSITWDCDCGKKMSQEIVATGCDTVTVTVAATCYTYAYTFTYCKNATCDAKSAEVATDYIVTVEGKTYNVVAFEITGTELDADNHYNAVYGEVRVPADCQNAGVKVDYCTGCHALDKSYAYGPEGHAFDKENNGVKVSDATCTEAAKYTVKCTYCTATEDYTVGEALGHTWGAEQKVDATCAGAGYTYKVCETCSKNEKTGDITFTTSAVNGIYVDYATANKEHNLNAEADGVAVREGTCTLVGLLEYTCADCGKVYVQTGKGGEGHVWEDTEDLAKDATCTEKGYVNAQACKNCDATKPGYETDALGHDLTEVVAKNATCTENGAVAHFACATCKKNFTTAEATEEVTGAVVIPALGHKFVAGVCTVCDYACDHESTLDLIEISTATCKGEGKYGYKYYGCTECGYECWTNFVDIPAHEFVEKETKPTCTVEGATWKECACGEKIDVVVLPMTHTNAAGDKLVDNCLDTAEDRVCVDCGETIGQSCHLVTTVVAQDCKTLGYTVVACADCGTVESTTVNTEFGAHKYGTPVVVEPTYATEGTSTEVCTVCGDNKVTKLDKKSGLNIKLEAANKYDFVEYVDGSYVVVKIVADANNINTWSFKFTVSYDEAVLNFVEGAVATTIAGTTASGLVSAKDGVATVLGFASNNADGKMQNIALNGEDIVLATLVFKVDSDAEATAAFAVETVEIVDKAGADVDAATTVTTEDATIATQLYLDINNDGVIDLEDLNAMVKIMANEVAADAEIIKAAADANHDGAINEADLSILLNTLVK